MYKECVEMRTSENSYAKIMCTPCISTVIPHTIVCQPTSFPDRESYESTKSATFIVIIFIVIYLLLLFIIFTPLCLLSCTDLCIFLCCLLGVSISRVIG